MILIIAIARSVFLSILICMYLIIKYNRIRLTLKYKASENESTVKNYFI